MFENLGFLKARLSVMGLGSVDAAAERQAGPLVILVARCGHCPFHPTVCALIWILWPFACLLTPIAKSPQSLVLGRSALGKTQRMQLLAPVDDE